MADVDVKVNLDMPRILSKLENDSFGLFLIHEWKRLINPFTPHREGILEDNVAYRPFEMTYMEPYSHYMYHGIVYVDPQYKKGGFTSDGGITFWSRPGIEKIPTGRPFNYTKDHNPQATDHWDKAAEKAGKKEELIEVANRYLRRLG